MARTTKNQLVTTPARPEQPEWSVRDLFDELTATRDYVISDPANREALDHLAVIEDRHAADILEETLFAFLTHLSFGKRQPAPRRVLAEWIHDRITRPEHWRARIAELKTVQFQRLKNQWSRSLSAREERERRDRGGGSA